MPLPLVYTPPLDNTVSQWLQINPDLREFYTSLEDSISNNPEQASKETFVLKDGRKINCYTKSVRATDYSKNMIYSKDEIIILYEILANEIRVVNVYFPNT